MNDPKKTVLVIEDDFMMQKALNKKLTGEGFDVLLAQDGVEGLKTALEKHPDIITLDILMPNKNGVVFMDEIRKDPWGKSVRIIILTNYDASDKMISKIIEDQPSYYLLKTNTSLDNLVSKIKELTGTVI